MESPTGRPASLWEVSFPSQTEFRIPSAPQEPVAWTVISAPRAALRPAVCAFYKPIRTATLGKRGQGSADKGKLPRPGAGVSFQGLVDPEGSLSPSRPLPQAEAWQHRGGEAAGGGGQTLKRNPQTPRRRQT